MRHPAVVGGVYFLEAPSLDLVKIGTAINVAERIRSLRLILPVETQIVRVVPGGGAEERALHARFSAHRVRGEWFYAPPVLDVLGELGDDLCVDTERLRCIKCGSWGRTSKKRRCERCDGTRTGTLTSQAASNLLGVPVHVVHELWRRGALEGPDTPALELYVQSVHALKHRDLTRLLDENARRCGVRTVHGRACIASASDKYGGRCRMHRDVESSALSGAP